MPRRLILRFAQVVFCLAVTIHGVVVLANQFGVTEATKKPGSTFNGCTCHGETPSANVFVSISGPDTLVTGQIGQYTVTITGGPATGGGTNIAVSNGILSPGDLLLQEFRGELTHKNPVPFSDGRVVFRFDYRAPASVGIQTLYANGNSVNLDGTNSGDQWNFAPDKRVVVLDPATNVGQRTSVSRSFTLHQNYPNPFNPSTLITYDVPAKSVVTLNVYDLLGREMATLVNGEQAPGNYRVRFTPPTGIPSGTYLYRLTAGSYSDQKTMTLVR